MLERVIAAAEAAGRVIQEIRESGFDVEQKGSQGPVTQADRAADKLLRTELLAIEACGWLSEETADDQSRLNESRLWVVDPLDGTKEFVKGLPDSTKKKARSTLLSHREDIDCAFIFQVKIPTDKAARSATPVRSESLRPMIIAT